MKTILKALLLLVALTLVVPVFAQSDFEATKARAETGNAEAQYDLGVMYANGMGVAKNDQEAVKWYRLAADQGLANAQYNLGWMYENCKGVQSDDWASVERQIRQLPGQATAAGNCLGVDNINEAFKWYELASRSQFPAAFTALGSFYLEGKGRPQNEREALEFFRQASDLGDSLADYMLGYLYANGRAVVQNHQEALKWYLSSAAKGDANAFAALGNMYENGIGVSKDQSQAYVYYSVASAQGHAGSIRSRDRVGSDLSERALRRAQAQATRCFESNYQDCD